MDSLGDYVEHAKRGGPAGELIVRNSLQEGLRMLGVAYSVAGSDEEFERLFRERNFSHLILDEWTVLDRSSRLRVDHPNIFVLAFFGSADGAHVSGLPPERFLTAYPYPSMHNTFLGFMVPEIVVKGGGKGGGGMLGVLWGKRLEYFAGREALLADLATAFPGLELVTTLAAGEAAADAGRGGGLPSGVRNLGPLSPPAWGVLLRDAAFLLGLGHPLGGPSAVEAVSAGAMYLDPILSPPPEGYPEFDSQHPFLRRHVGPPNVCSVDLSDHASVFACVGRALERRRRSSRGGGAPLDFTSGAYLTRLKKLFIL